MLGAGANDMSKYWEPKERRTKDLSARVTKTVYDGVKAVARLWTTVERHRTGDTEYVVSAGDVVNRLLGVGIEGAFAEFGGQVPKTEEEWQKIEATVRKRISKL